MLLWSRFILGSILRLLQSRRDLLLENLVLRQQLAVLRRHRRKQRIRTADKLFWVFIRRLWNGWQRSLAIVTPETVVRWHRAGFRLYWTWPAPRIHGELQMLGFDISERTVSRWVRRVPRNPDPAKRWLAFLHNHREL